MNISKDTKIYGSFSANPGNNGARFFNQAFDRNNIDAIYIPFKSENTKDSIVSILNLNICGAAFSMPHKERVLEYLDVVSTTAQEIMAVNTVVNQDGVLTGYNTIGT